MGSSSGDDAAILHPGRAHERFSIDRFVPSDNIGRFVDHYWLVRWRLQVGEVHTQRVLSHPVVNVTVSPDGARVVGPTTDVIERELVGASWTVGIMFRPAGFWPLLREPLTTIARRDLALGEVLAADAASRIREASRLVAERSEKAAVLDTVLSKALPKGRQASEVTTELAELARADRTIVRTQQLADAAGTSARTLQRNFSAHVGLSPKDVIRRYRLHEVAGRAAGDHIDWAALAAELGYADQPHLIRDFRAVTGETPARYARET